MAEPTIDRVRTRTSLLGRLGNWDDDTSWRDFYATYSRRIYAFALTAGLTPSEAEDVVQETFVDMAMRLPRFKYDRTLGSFTSWLLTNSRWHIADQLRSRPPVQTYAFSSVGAADAPDPLQDVPDPSTLDLGEPREQDWEQNLFYTALATVKRRVDPRTYQVFDFYVNKDWPAAKVAATFGIAVGQVYLSKHRVAEMIKAEIGRRVKSVL